LPAVLGHEGAGIVEAVGPNVRDLKVGDHVVLTYGACGHCNPCRGGHGAYCRDFFALNFGGDDGHGHTAITDAQGQPLHDHFFAQSSFATFALAREINAIKVPDDAPLELLGPLGCGIQTGAGAVLNSLQVRSGSSFASYGAGAVGLSAVMAAKVAGATTIIAIDVVPSRLELALELGATHVVNSRETDVVEAVRAITGGGADFALESTGRPDVLSAGIEALGGLGMMGVVGAPKLGTTASFDVNNLLLGGRSIRGIVEGVHSAAGDPVPAGALPVRQAGEVLSAGTDQPGGRRQHPWHHPEAGAAHRSVTTTVGSVGRWPAWGRIRFPGEGGSDPLFERVLKRKRSVVET
jgi:aryl-alcohol dehydrogenase